MSTFTPTSNHRKHLIVGGGWLLRAMCRSDDDSSRRTAYGILRFLSKSHTALLATAYKLVVDCCWVRVADLMVILRVGSGLLCGAGC